MLVNSFFWCALPAATAYRIAPIGLDMTPAVPQSLADNGVSGHDLDSQGSKPAAKEHVEHNQLAGLIELDDTSESMTWPSVKTLTALLAAAGILQESEGYAYLAGGSAIGNFQGGRHFVETHWTGDDSQLIKQAENLGIIDNEEQANRDLDGYVADLGNCLDPALLKIGDQVRDKASGALRGGSAQIQKVLKGGQKTLDGVVDAGINVFLASKLGVAEDVRTYIVQESLCLPRFMTGVTRAATSSAVTNLLPATYRAQVAKKLVQRLIKRKIAEIFKAILVREPALRHPARMIGHGLVSTELKPARGTPLVVHNKLSGLLELGDTSESKTWFTRITALLAFARFLEMGEGHAYGAGGSAIRNVNVQGGTRVITSWIGDDDLLLQEAQKNNINTDAVEKRLDHYLNDLENVLDQSQAGSALGAALSLRGGNTQIQKVLNGGHRALDEMVDTGINAFLASDLEAAKNLRTYIAREGLGLPKFMAGATRAVTNSTVTNVLPDRYRALVGRKLLENLLKKKLKAAREKIPYPALQAALGNQLRKKGRNEAQLHWKPHHAFLGPTHRRQGQALVNEGRSA